MKQLLVIPKLSEIAEWEKLAAQYHLGYEYNDFFDPAILQDEEVAMRRINAYKEHTLPSFCTMHGAFYDVLPTSADKTVREVGQERIRQSIRYAKKIGAKAVVFHTNYNPFLNNKEYVENWLKENSLYWESVLKEHPEIDIYLENMFDATPELMKGLAEKLCRYENFGICLDYAHATLSKTDVKVWVETLGKYIKHVHINDNDLSSDLHLAWGEGNINRQNFYELYRNYIKEATVLIETSNLAAARSSIEMLIKEGFYTER